MTAPLQYGTPPPGDPTAVMGRRVLAWLADLALFSAVVLAGFASMSEYTEIPPGVAEADACDLFEQQHPDAADTCLAYDGDIYLLDTGEAGVQTLLSFGWFAFFVVLQGLTGGSPGKLLFGLRVVDEQGRRCGIGKSLGRTLLWVVDGAPWIVPVVGAITGFTSTGHRRVGDLAAGTYVVASSSVGTPVGAAVSGAPGAQAWGTPPPVGQGWTPSAGPPPAPWPSSPPPSSPPPATPAPPTVEPDADWSRAPDASAAEPAAPEWSAPTLPEISEPATEWQPPTTPGPDWSSSTEPEAAPAEPAPFAAPGAEATSSPAGPPVADAAPPAAEAAPAPEWPAPQWDQARGTYLQWDPNRQAWLQWDATRQHWKPIDT
ncbi:MAG TPA: RDD family protein [Acidimicrobiales bacterium]|nr:RDD family protein [Acidimicrobiales bacterium]